MVVYIIALAFVVVFVVSIAQSVRDRKRPLRGDQTFDGGGDGHVASPETARTTVATATAVAATAVAGTVEGETVAGIDWRALLNLTVTPLRDFLTALNAGERSVLYILLGLAAGIGYLLGRRRRTERGRPRRFSGWRFPSFQNAGEALVSRVLLRHFRAPDYHLMNHLTLRMDDGTTQVDHVLVSRFGVFVIDTKDYSGWIFANERDAKWTQVRFRVKHR